MFLRFGTRALSIGMSRPLRISVCTACDVGTYMS